MPTNEPTTTPMTETTTTYPLLEQYLVMEHAFVWNAAPEGTCALCRQLSDGPRHHLWRFAGGGAFARYEEQDNTFLHWNKVLRMDPDYDWSQETMYERDVYQQTDRAERAGDFDLRDGHPLAICRFCAAMALDLGSGNLCEFLPTRLWERSGVQRAFRRFGELCVKSGRPWRVTTDDPLQTADASLERGVHAYSVPYHVFDVTVWDDSLGDTGDLWETSHWSDLLTVTGQAFDPQQVYIDLLRRLKPRQPGFNPA